MERFIPEQWTPENRSALKSGLAYGLGWVGGTFVSWFLLNQVSILFVDAMAGQIARLVVGILLAFFIAGIGAGIGGFAGGIMLPVVHRERGRWGYAWRSALVIGVIYGSLLYPIGFILGMLIFYANGEDVSILRFATLFGFLGIIFGALVGLFLAIVTVGRHGLGRIVRASTVGFGIGGVLLGIGVRQYLFSFDAARPNSEQEFWVLFGILGLGFCGGYTLGFVYQRLADTPVDYLPDSRRRVWFRRLVVLAVALFLIFGLFRPLVAGLADFLTPVPPSLDNQLNSKTVGTHWAPPVNLTDLSGGTAVRPNIAVNDANQLAVTFARRSAEQNEVIYLSGSGDGENGLTVWTELFAIPARANLENLAPQVALDNRGAAHLVWVDTANGGSDIFYTQCQGENCSEPVALSAPAAINCGSTDNQAPALAVNAADTLMVVWQSGSELAFSSWATTQAPGTGTAGCLPGESSVQTPRVSGTPAGFAAVFAAGTEAEAAIHQAAFQNSWQAASTVGRGHDPQIYTDRNGQLHLAWCSPEGAVSYASGALSETVSPTGCAGRPEILLDSQNQIQILWLTDEVENNLGLTQPANVLFESVRSGGSWQPPNVVANPGNDSGIGTAGGSDGRLYQVASNQNDIFYATHLPYTCDEADLGRLDQIMLATAGQDQFRPEGSTVPFCGNRYDRLLYTPNPDPAYSDLEPTPNGAFDPMFDLLREAEYEALFSTMWYDADAGNQDSPGSLLAQAVADLYQQVSDNPADYPRGMTVRIMLGNPPEVAKGDFTNQLWNVLGDLRAAGVPEMVNEDIGWRLEVADFSGSFPHSHTKSLIVDGKTAVAAGYNMSYEHFPADHPSGKGNGRHDLGIQITGPVAQDAQAMFDDLWSDSDMRHCTDFFPAYIIWQVTCRDSKATDDHVPEVLKYYLPGGNAAAFSMHRTEAFDEADIQIEEGLLAAQESIDIIHVNFTSEMVCDLNLIYDRVCTFAEVLPYLDNMVNVADEHGVQVRILIKSDPIDGVESSVALQLLLAELAERGIDDRVEIRFFDGPVHTKATLIDNEFLIVGSQNYHYSAFGVGGGLTEYNLGTSDPQAVEDFSRLFTFQWEQAQPMLAE